jgi:hypothetical protein
MRAIGVDKRMMLDLPKVTKLGGSITAEVQGCKACAAATAEAPGRATDLAAAAGAGGV